MKYLISDAKGNISTTKTMNLIFFVLAISTAIIGIWVDLSPEHYGYIGGLCGGSFLQYSYGKKLLNGKK